MAALDRYRRELGVEYLDGLLYPLHDEAQLAGRYEADDGRLRRKQERKVIRLKGMSCHGLPALRQAAKVPWADMQLARINPQGHGVDGEDPGQADADMAAAGQELKTMKAIGRGIIGMKLVGNGDFKNRGGRGSRHAVCDAVRVRGCGDHRLCRRR